jgi:1-hydroxycarotenoid 3,4-desaturase
MREALVEGARIDCGPTVFTMRWVFEALFARAGASLEDYLMLRPFHILARHAWNEGEQLDLFADNAESADAIGRFAGAREARGFQAFCADARAIYRSLEQPFIASSRPNLLTLAARIRDPAKLFAIRPFETLWKALSGHFRDPRLRQLFARYATYNGASPYAAPATLMLIAHVEQNGVWEIVGGMQRLAEALTKLATAKQVVFRFGCEARRIMVSANRASGVELASGERLEADAIVVNADAAALAIGLFGAQAAAGVAPLAPRQRSLSAVTWAMVARAEGFALHRHNVFFSRDYATEFDDIFLRGALPMDPTVYVCAQDRGDDSRVSNQDRLLVLVNAPPTGDNTVFAPEEIAKCEARMMTLLARCGLNLKPQASAITTPADFHRLFPATGGALYGRAPHGWTASFRRPPSWTNIRGLYLAGGSTHPGAGVPMAALSGHQAALRVVSDLASMRRFHPVAISGGISTGSATTDVSPSR